MGTKIERKRARRCDVCHRPEDPFRRESRIRESEVLHVALCQRCIAECVTIALDLYAIGLDDEEYGGQE